MPPQTSRYPPQNLSNPFAHLNQPNLHQSSHFQQPTAGLASQNFGGHPGFAGSNHNGGLSIFGPQSAAGGLQGGFGSAGSIGGGTGLASHAAQLGFAHGAVLQQQQHEAGLNASLPKGQTSRVREVWRSNLAEEMSTLRSLIDRYPYVSMDTEFPGVVARPIGDFSTKASYHYQTLRCNVDLLKIIQLGITLFSIEGEPVPTTELAAVMSRGVIANNIKVCPCTWTFNFKFSPDEDMYNEESLNLLKKAGSDFDKHLTMGIDPDEFGSLLISSGMVMSDDVHWISFHSGYDFAYLVKLMKPELLPENEDDYRDLVKIFFPNIYDVKFLLRHAQKLLQRGILPGNATALLNNLGTKSGLQDLAEELGCQRIGVQHQAGSDAWLTGSVFWQMRTKVFDGQIPEELNGEMWGLTGVGPPAPSSVQAAMLAAHNPQHNGLSGASVMYHSALTPLGQRAEPATPTNNTASLAGQTCGHGYGGGMTPGAGGVFGNFQPTVFDPSARQFTPSRLLPASDENRIIQSPALSRSYAQAARGFRQQQRRRFDLAFRDPRRSRARWSRSIDPGQARRTHSLAIWQPLPPEPYSSICSPGSYILPAVNFARPPIRSGFEYMPSTSFSTPVPSSPIEDAYTHLHQPLAHSNTVNNSLQKWIDDEFETQPPSHFPGSKHITPDRVASDRYIAIGGDGCFRQSKDDDWVPVYRPPYEKSRFVKWMLAARTSSQSPTSDETPSVSIKLPMVDDHHISPGSIVSPLFSELTDADLDLALFRGQSRGPNQQKRVASHQMPEPGENLSFQDEQRKRTWTLSEDHTGFIRRRAPSRNDSLLD